MNFRETHPDIKLLKQQFIDPNRNAYSAATLHCVAYMLLEIDRPEQVVHIGLAHLIEKLGVCRADAGFATPADSEYTPIAEARNPHTDPPSITGFVLPNQHSAMQNVWNATTPWAYESVDSNECLLDLIPALRQLECKSMLMYRLLWDQNPIGITCIDHTRDDHHWQSEETDYFQRFCDTFLGPLAGISNYWFNPKLHSMFSKPSDSELTAIRLAAQGYSYKEIAYQLKKSVRTIENQFRNARRRLSARNQIDLIKKCRTWL